MVTHEPRKLVDSYRNVRFETAKTCSLLLGIFKGGGSDFKAPISPTVCHEYVADDCPSMYRIEVNGKEPSVRRGAATSLGV